MSKTCCDYCGHETFFVDESGNPFCLKCKFPASADKIGGIDTTAPVEHVMQNTTHPIENVKLTKAMIDDLAKGMDEMPPESERIGSRREYELSMSLHEARGEVKAYKYAVKVLAERLYYYAVLHADDHSAGKSLVEDPIDFIDDCLREEDDKVHDSEIASDAVMKAASEYEARHGRKP